ncbi:hypothetical protein LCGC14_1779430, partial [marine sediment metagenome]
MTGISSNNSNIELIPKPQSHIVPGAWKKQFLETYAETGNKTFSALNAGVTVRTVYNHIHSDKEFATNVEVAKQNAIMVLHQEAWRRAMGEDIHDAEGEVIGRTRTSDKLLIFLLSSMSPADYGHGAIAAEQQRNNIVDGQAQIKITLPENFRGKFTLGVENVFPDASVVVDAEFSDVDTPSELQVSSE